MSEEEKQAEEQEVNEEQPPAENTENVEAVEGEGEANQVIQTYNSFHKINRKLQKKKLRKEVMNNQKEVMNKQKGLLWTHKDTMIKI